MEEMGDGVASTPLATKMAIETIAKARATTDKALNTDNIQRPPIIQNFLTPPTHESQVKLK
jgi:hypothetical protein